MIIKEEENTEKEKAAAQVELHFKAKQAVEKAIGLPAPKMRDPSPVG